MPAVKAVAGPSWGFLSDKIGKKKTIFLITKTLSAMALLTYAIPNFAVTFLHILLISVCINVFVAPGVLNAYTLEVCGPHSKSLYGKIRLYKAMSWGIGCGVMGVITDHFGFDYNFIIYGVLSAISIGTIWYLVPSVEKKDSAIESSTESVVDERSFYNDFIVPVFCQRRDVIVFLIELFVMGAAVALVERLLFVYVKNDLEGSTTLCGLSVLVTVLFELPVFHYSAQILDKLGHNGCFLVAYASYSIRVWAYTFLTKDNVWLLLPIESLHGFTFAVMWIAAVEFTRSWSPPGWKSTSQSIMSTTYQCIAVLFGSVVGSHLMESHGAIDVYRAAGLMIACMFILRLIMNILL
jgi:MFS family permease